MHFKENNFLNIIYYEQSRDTGNIGHTTRNGGKQKKKKKKMWYGLHVSEININIYDIIINSSHSIKSRNI
jgi:hypothetical protein